jgi:hypothetical protein
MEHERNMAEVGGEARAPAGASMHLVEQCSNCGTNVRRELGVVTVTTVQHRECADRFGVATHGQSIVIPNDHAIRHRPRATALLTAIPLRAAGRGSGRGPIFSARPCGGQHR